MLPVCPFNGFQVYSQVSVFQRSIVLSWLPDAIFVPSGEKTILDIIDLFTSKGFTIYTPVSVFQIHIA